MSPKRIDYFPMVSSSHICRLSPTRPEGTNDLNISASPSLPGPAKYAVSHTRRRDHYYGEEDRTPRNAWFLFLFLVKEFRGENISGFFVERKKKLNKVGINHAFKTPSWNLRVWNQNSWKVFHSTWIFAGIAHHATSDTFVDGPPGITSISWVHLFRFLSRELIAWTSTMEVLTTRWKIPWCCRIS